MIDHIFANTLKKSINLNRAYYTTNKIAYFLRIFIDAFYEDIYISYLSSNFNTHDLWFRFICIIVVILTNIIIVLVHQNKEYLPSDVFFQNYKFIH